MTAAELKAAAVLAVLAGLAAGLILAWAEMLRREQQLVNYVYRPDEVPPADVSALLEEARRITGEADGGAR